jgi:hypothetical protein
MALAGSCNLCGKEADELCPDGNCRDCHKALSWEDCVTGTWNARRFLKVPLAPGLSPEDLISMVKQMYPDAQVEEEIRELREGRLQGHD